MCRLNSKLDMHDISLKANKMSVRTSALHFKVASSI